MTPRGAGWLTGLAMFASMAVLQGAVMVARNAANADDAADAGEPALLIALRIGLLAAAAGLLVARIARSRRGRRPAMLAAISSYAAIGLWVWWQSTRSPRTPEEDSVEYVLELIAAFVTTGTTFALAAAVLAWWIARHAVGRDGAEQVLALETTNLNGSQNHWGAAMRAELASIDDPAQRGRFARSASGPCVSPRHR